MVAVTVSPQGGIHSNYFRFVLALPFALLMLPFELPMLGGEILVAFAGMAGFAFVSELVV